MPTKAPSGNTTLLARLQKKPATSKPKPEAISPSRLPVLKGRREPTSKLASQVVNANDLNPPSPFVEVLNDLASLRVSTPYEIRTARNQENLSQLRTQLAALSAQLKAKVKFNAYFSLRRRSASDWQEN